MHDVSNPCFKRLAGLLGLPASNRRRLAQNEFFATKSAIPH